WPAFFCSAPTVCIMDILLISLEYNHYSPSPWAKPHANQQGVCEMAAVEKASESVRAVGRALEILSAFSPVDFELSPGELVKRVDLSRPTMYRLLHTLEVNGYLVSSGDPQKFRLGPQVARLAHVWMSSNDPAAAALPMMRRVWEVSNETVGLFVREGDSRICVAELVSPHPLSFRRGVG